MLGFKKFTHAAIAMSGIELAQKIRKGQFNIASLMTDVRMRVPQIWEALLVA